MSNHTLPRVSASMLRTWGECKRKYYMSYRLGWKTPPKPALVFGDAWSYAMDVIWIGASLGDSADYAKAKALEGFCSIWERDSVGFVDEWRSANIAREMIENYVTQRWDWLHTIDILEVEQPFKVVIGERKEGVFEGCMDKVYRDVNGDIWICDHKTTSLYSRDEGGSIQSRYWRGYDVNHQVDGYLWRAKKAFGDYVRGFVLDVALVHKQRHDIFEFWAVNRTQEQIDAWEDEAVWHLVDMNMTESMEKWTRNPSSCSNYGGCEYLDVCKFAPTIESLKTPPEGIVLKDNPMNYRVGIEDG